MTVGRFGTENRKKERLKHQQQNITAAQCPHSWKAAIINITKAKNTAKHTL